MKIRNLFIPKTRLGFYSIVAILLFIGLFIIGRSVVIKRGPFEHPSFFNDPIPAAITIVAGLFGVSALVAGLVAVIKGKERAIPVVLAALVGLFVLIFWLGEILGPH